MKNLYRFVLIASTCLSAAPALAGEGASPYLTGDWGGRRVALENRGVDVQATLTVDALANISGGIKRGGDVMDNEDLSVTLDGEKLYGLYGSTVFVDVIGATGDEFNTKRVGSGEGISSIETGDPTVKFLEAWVEQTFLNDRASLRAGLYDVNSEFDVTEASGLFINPTFGMDTAFAVTGTNGPSAFPVTSLAARLDVKPIENTYLRAAVLDGVPGDPNNPDGTHIRFDDNDGALWALEGGYGDLALGHVALGGWHYTAEADNYAATGKDNGAGVYALAEKTLYDGLDGFVRIALANDEVSQFDYSGSLGVTYTAPFAGRPDDALGLALHGAHNGKPARDAGVTSGSPLEASEWGIEATYNAAVLPFLSVQPDVQYIKNPGTTADVGHATVVGVRTAVTF